ncbi:two-component system sensor histidine kinase NtrB [Hyphomicrobium sulfonivorans]|uniref:two-component system sensor histidine kinase NtrB n=1 Tax=Hyphomicrobium sulfonivorans TaxID=121290 RepID=UPI00156EC956|nr:ATP-binding protein [Hyphomicrobium sulfonivorans]MBI1650516.1 two-component sensor histidine kinase [Hyphomicrobium sulfonivorans]NSL72126.1 two-component sensor histidine kinase [Hyphomicrobium sulfonivorans]
MSRRATTAATRVAANVNTRRPIEHDLLLSALPHPILVLADDNRIVFANAAAEAFLSIGVALLKRAKLDEVVAFGCPLLQLVDQVRTSGVTLNEYGVEVASPKFQIPKLVDVYGGPMPESPGYVVLMFQQRNMAQMIERQLTHRAAARSVSGLASVLAHEIKNPLSGIRGAAQLLEQGLSDEDRALSQLICSETDRIRNLVDRMEVFGDERPLAKDPVNIHDVLDHVRRLCESGFGRGVRFVADYDPSLPPVPGNRDKLVQAMLNLVKNAVEAIGDNRTQGRIIIQTSFRPGVRLSVPGSDMRISLPLMIQIEDNGGGVPDDIKEHLFDPFVTTKLNGTGLGLALVAKIINDHGGVIELDNEPNRTIFRVLLPMQARDRSGDTPK